MKNYGTMAFILIFLAFILAACGSGAGEVSKKITVNMVEFMFTPNDFTVPAGEEITLELNNNGAVEHNFVILKKGETAEVNFDHDANLDKILFEAKLGPGETGTFTLALPEAGEYEIICSIPGHLAAGMQAKLVAKDVK